MILNTKEFKNICSIILSAVDGSELSNLTETLELKNNWKNINVINNQ